MTVDTFRLILETVIALTSVINTGLLVVDFIVSR